MMTDKAAVELSSPGPAPSSEACRRARRYRCSVGARTRGVRDERHRRPRRAEVAFRHRDRRPSPPKNPSLRGSTYAAEAQRFAAHGVPPGPIGARARHDVAGDVRRRAKEARRGSGAWSLEPGPGGRIDAQGLRRSFSSPHGDPHGGLPVVRRRPTLQRRRSRRSRSSACVASSPNACSAGETQEIPHFSYVEEIDITELESLRQHLNSKKQKIKLGAAHVATIPRHGADSRAVRDFPQCNAPPTIRTAT